MGLWQFGGFIVLASLLILGMEYTASVVKAQRKTEGTSELGLVLSLASALHKTCPHCEAQYSKGRFDVDT